MGKNDSEGRYYVCIDLKSFYASVECVERGLDPLSTNLVVADPTRTEKTICLAVSPSMKALGVKNRCRVFEIPANIDYIMAIPRMQKYIDYSADIYSVYLKYIAKEDMHVYSIDEVFMDVTNYLDLYKMTPKELAVTMMQDVLKTTGITATAGIGTNMYLTKIALDITAKHVADHIGYLDEELYKKTLWNHRPLQDFWMIGNGTARHLEKLGIYTMGELAHASEDILYKNFGINAELLIDHAWGRETTTISDIKNYKSSSNSISSGQVLGEAADRERGKLLLLEMVDLSCLDLIGKGVVTESITVYLSPADKTLEPYRGSVRLPNLANTFKVIKPYIEKLYERIVPQGAYIKRLNVSFNNLVDEAYEQFDLFTNMEDIEKDRKVNMAVLDIKKKFGKNAIVKGMNLLEGGTTIERNSQIGGHRSGN